MNNNGWFYEAVTLTANYVPKEFGFKAKHLKLKGDVTFSFDGENDNGKLVAGDGMQAFSDVEKSKIFVKGTGTLEVIAWDGN